MFEYYNKAEMDKLKVLGSFFGVEFKEDKKKKGFIPFKGPDQYNKLSPEEKERLTKEMMGSHKDFVEGRQIKSTLLGKKPSGGLF